MGTNNSAESQTFYIIFHLLGVSADSFVASTAFVMDEEGLLSSDQKSSLDFEDAISPRYEPYAARKYTHYLPWAFNILLVLVVLVLVLQKHTTPEVFRDQLVYCI